VDLALRALLNPGEEVTLHEPCYVSVSRHDPVLLTAHPSRETRPGKRVPPYAGKCWKPSYARTKVLMLNFR